MKRSVVECPGKICTINGSNKKSEVLFKLYSSYFDFTPMLFYLISFFCWGNRIGFHCFYWNLDCIPVLKKYIAHHICIGEDIPFIIATKIRNKLFKVLVKLMYAVTYRRMLLLHICVNHYNVLYRRHASYLTLSHDSLLFHLFRTSIALINLFCQFPLTIKSGLNH